MKKNLKFKSLLIIAQDGTTHPGQKIDRFAKWKINDGCI